MTDQSLLANPTIDVLRGSLTTATSEIALALGLVRVLTLLPLYDASLDQIERHLAETWQSLLELKRLLDDEQRMLSQAAARQGSGPTA